MANRSIFFLWENFGPYHLDRLSRVKDRFAPEFNVFGIELFTRSRVYDWEVSAKRSVEIVTLFNDHRRRSLWTRLFRNKNIVIYMYLLGPEEKLWVRINELIQIQ